MKKCALYLTIVIAFTSCVSSKKFVKESDKSEVNLLLDNWHRNAAETNFDNYFNAMATESVFIGTDATEYWNKKDFMTFSKPYFDKGKAWNFTSLERNVYFSDNGETAWFDELLNTQMKICRGSGVLVKENKNWKIKQYVLSMTIPNDKSNEVISLKSAIEDRIINEKKK